MKPDKTPGDKIRYDENQKALRAKNKEEELAKRKTLEDAVLSGLPPGINP